LRKFGHSSKRLAVEVTVGFDAGTPRFYPVQLSA
jgi:hypothetical protein